MMKKLLRNFKVESWWSKTRWRTSSSPIKKMKRNCFNGVQSQQYVICVTFESIKAKTNRAWLNKVNSKNGNNWTTQLKRSKEEQADEKVVEDVEDNAKMKTYNQQIRQHRQDESNTSFIKKKKFYIKPLPTSLYGEKTNAKKTRSSKRRQYTIELPDEGMVDDMDPSTERRCPINRNNENTKLINIDVSDVIKLLKYMQRILSALPLVDNFRRIRKIILKTFLKQQVSEFFSGRTW
ncbi:Hypothetical predicted protein [Paramuricea clavata]|uniref:Uncharacterized protein n=1 Tax=Paramuricea clavata TaxID=317549 RepID=A0A7D9HCX9_PARCT|nr:Hypothetical predicted protein [Paramuricea clavata]